MTAPKRIVIVGAGHAGVELAAALRQHGHAGTIDLVSDEADIPYQRPPLSKDYIKRGSVLVLRPEKFFAEQDIRLHMAVRAEAIDRAAGRVLLSNGESLGYDHLVFATGARNRRLPLPGLDHPSIVELRTLADARSILERIVSWRRVVVIGGGFIGLEAAGLLATMDIGVDVVEMAPRLMQRAVSPIVSEWFRQFHLHHGVTLHMPQQVAAIEHGDEGPVAVLGNDERLGCDAVILAAGVAPNVELAQAAGLEVGNGIVVDENLVTSDERISAIGDCAVYPSIHLPGMARLESVQNASDQAKAVAMRLVGEPRAYDALPWFWSIQGEARLQIAGLGRPDLDAVVRGDPAAGKFSVFLYDGDRLAAVESVNAPGDHMAARRLLGAGTPVPRPVAADMSVELKSLII